MMRRILGFFAGLSILIAVAGPATAGKLGPEFIVSATGLNSSVAPLRDGSFVVVWRGDDPRYAISGQRYNANGVKIGQSFVVIAASHERAEPAVAALAGGGFAVTWDAADSSGLGVWVQRFTAGAAKLGGKLRANAFTVGNQSGPSAAGLKDGSLVVTWTSDGQGGSITAVYAQRVGANGIKQGGEFRVDTTFPTAFHHSPSVAALTSGGFAIVYRGFNGTYARRFNATGAGIGNDFQVNPGSESLLQRPVVAGLKNGGFVVIREVQTGSQRDVFAQRYHANGLKAGGNFRVNQSPANEQFDPAVAPLTTGGYVVVWAGGTSTHLAQGRLYNANFVAIGGNFSLNATVIPIDARPSVAPLAGGRFVATWQGSAPGATFAVRAQRFDGK